jgi:hypothetical protein
MSKEQTPTIIRSEQWRALFRGYYGELFVRVSNSALEPRFAK